ncbi:MAG: ABC transporter permease, partial [Firmicutes bacterium]|nr:ABC transporter permease [Bacillota bacterium]
MIELSQQDVGRSPWRFLLIWRIPFFARLFQHRLALVGLIVLVVMLIGSIGAPLFTNQNPETPNLFITLSPPMPGHPLGTDDLGRDVWSRLLYGGRISFLVGFGATVISTVVATIYGAISGYLGGIGDRLMMRFVDLMLSFPAIFLLLVVLNLTGGNASVFLMIFYLGLLGWGGLSRIVRAQVLYI